MIVGGTMTKPIILVSLCVAFAISVFHSRPAAAECNCLAVAADVSAAVREDVARADSLYARGDYDAALEIYARAHAETGDAVLLYAQGMAHWQLGAGAEAKAKLEAFVAAGGDAELSARAEAAVSSIDSGVTKAVDLGLGGVGGAVGVGGDVVGGVRAKASKPKKVAKGAAVILAVVAVAAVAVVGYNSIHARKYESVEFDKTSNLSLGVAGVAVGGTAVYLWGLTAAAGATAGCVTEAPRIKTPRRVVTPFAAQGGGGLAAALTF